MALVLWAGLLLFSESDAVLAASQLHKLQTLVDELIQLQKEKRDVLQQWNQDERVLTAEKNLLENRKQNLADKRTQQQKNIDGLKAEKRELTERRNELQQAVDELTAVTRRFRSKILSLTDRMPAPLYKDLESSIRKLEKRRELVPGENLLSCMRTCTEIVRETATFNRDLHTTRRILTTPDGERREMRVMYIGLSSAFGISTTGTPAVACRGKPAENGWQWSWGREWVQPVRRAFRVYDKDDPASFVDLPLAFDEE